MEKTAWYYAKGDRQQGPVTWEKLSEMAASGELSRDDLVWRDGAPDWYPAVQVEGLTFFENHAAMGADAADEISLEPEADSAKASVPPIDMRRTEMEEGEASESLSDEKPTSEAPGGDDHPQTVELPPSSARAPRKPPVIKELGDLTGISFTDAVRVAVDDAWTAFRILIMDPTGQLPEVHRRLGALRGMFVGSVYGIVLLVCFVLGRSAHLGFLSSLAGGVLLPAAIFAGIAATRLMLRGGGNYQADLFLAGCALLPIGFATLLSGIVWTVLPGSPVFLETFGLCYSALILCRGFKAIQRHPAATTALAGPLVLAASWWIVRWTMFQMMIPL